MGNASGEQKPEKPETEEVYTQDENTKDIPPQDKNHQVETPVIKDYKSSDSDANSDDLIEQSVNSNSSQFYESSNSKINYAVKIDESDTLSDIEDIKTDSASADSEDSALGSLPPDITPNDREEETQDRSDGSDSGIGSETTEERKLPNFNLDLPCEINSCTSKSTKTDDKDGDKTENRSTITPLKSSLKRKCSDDNIDEPQYKKQKKSIHFDDITVYYFPRAQGFSCVPSQGGSTLGMEWEHTHIQKFTLAEHALEQRRLHRQILQQLKNERHNLSGIALSSSEDSDTEEETSDISESELDLDSYYFLQPVPTRQRRALLRAAGVRKIEGYEKDECRDIRTSREFCGCACKGICNPDQCSCSMAGIKCQVDRLNFPCGCTRDGCGNTTGRIEFNPVRVRTHFIHTLMRLGLEKKNEDNQEAAKRQWIDSHNTNLSSCLSTSVYERERCLNHEDGLLRAVNLTPRVEVESCVNAGSFNNVHCNTNNVSAQRRNIEDNMSYVYANNSSNHNFNESNVQFHESNNHNNHTESYTSSILQGKGPPYTTDNLGFTTMSNNLQRFSSDINSYTYGQHADNHNFKGVQSFPASSFEEFAHSSQISMFSHYGPMYVSDYMHKPSTSLHESNALQYQNLHESSYQIYKNTTEPSHLDHKDSQYTTLMAFPYQPSNKLQTIDNDENWFSHNTLLNLDHSEQTTQDAADLHSQAVETSTENTSENIENFGELIKKTMVESVIV